MGNRRSHRPEASSSSSSLFDEAMRYVGRYAILMIVVQFFLAALFMAGLDKKNKNYIVSSLKSMKNAVDSHYDWTSKQLEEVPLTPVTPINEDDDLNEEEEDEGNMENHAGVWSRFVSFFAYLYLYALHAISGLISTIQMAVMPVGVIHGAFNHGIYEKTEEVAAASLVSILTTLVTTPITLFQFVSTSLARSLQPVLHGLVENGNTFVIGLVSRILANVLVWVGLLMVGRPLFNLISSMVSYLVRAPLTCLCPCFQWRLFSFPSCSGCGCARTRKKKEGGEEDGEDDDDQDASETEDETDALAKKKQQLHRRSSLPAALFPSKERSYVIISDND